MQILKVKERFDPNDREFVSQTKEHHLNRYTFVSNFMGQSYLDLCCGQGYGTNILKTLSPHADVLGIDIEQSVIENARQTYPACRFDVVDIRQEKFLTSKFDVITFFEALEHLDYADGLRVLEYLPNILNENGCFIVSIPRDAREDHNHYHKSSWSRSSLLDLLEFRFATVNTFGQSWETGEISNLDRETSDFFIYVCKSVKEVNND